MLRQENSDIPQTISILYATDEKDLPSEYMTTLCKLFTLLGAHGVSVLIPSGNDGVSKGDCKAEEGSEKVQFIPMFPASCTCGVSSLLWCADGHGFAGLWVTSIGSTSLGRTILGGTTSFHPEVAALLSGGGFSFHFPQESYQDRAVSTFLEQFNSNYAGFYK
jgi:tripeptidyl-peptidase-1